MLTTHEQIFWVYKTFLGRAPESSEIVEKLSSIGFEEICLAVARSSEFRSLDPSPFPAETRALVEIFDSYAKRKMCVDLGDRTVSWNCIKGEYEPMETRFIVDYMRRNPGGFVDGGANIGWHSLNVAMIQNCKVHSFEPRSFPFSCLAKTMEANDLQERATTHNFGLADRQAFTQIYWAKSGVNPGGATIDHAANTNAHHQESIELKTLDSLSLNDITLIKLDIEGAEYLALKGAEKTLSRCRPAIILEVIKDQIERVSGISAEDFVYYIRQLGYHEISEITHTGSLRAIVGNNPFVSTGRNISNLVCFR